MASWLGCTGYGLTWRKCVQLGHQAVNCTNGTINWRQIYGDDAFRLKQPVYPSDYDRMAKAKDINYEELTKRATEYAKVSSPPFQCYRR